MEDFLKWDENSGNIWRKATEICRKMKDHQRLQNDFHQAEKIKKAACKTLLFWTKNEENFGKFQEIF